MSLGPLTPYNPPQMEALRRYNVNRAGQFEVIWQPQYDFQTYATAGATQFTFFQTTIGAGGTTLADTSIRSAGQFPRPQEFLITGIQVYFRPGEEPETVGLADDAQQDFVNDVFAVLFGNAWLELFIGSKPYLQDGPLAKFTQQFKLMGDSAISDSTTAGAAQKSVISYATHCGRYYSITPVKLPANQNFNVNINFPAAVATPSGNDARIGVILDGFLYRLSQ